MQLDKDREILDGLDLMNLLVEYYRSRKRFFLSLGGKDRDGGFSSCILIDRKHAIEYFVATDHRNFYSTVSLGIGPVYVGLNWLVDEPFQSRIKMGNTVKDLEENLSLLDEYLH
ncbi:hypothetical protein [Herminiimonas sp. KBW02]|uniref:hypothetical protein n=1 Tax=Herminiimonas sp. KBW02 TaxID=2153363 RepID=UPI000F5B068F|nr:hypothetical protein [Herminiimonas sp. KBW02]